MEQVTSTFRLTAFLTFVAISAGSTGQTTAQSREKDGHLKADFRWTTGLPVVLPKDVSGITTHSIKDPSVVR